MEHVNMVFAISINQTVFNIGNRDSQGGHWNQHYMVTGMKLSVGM